MECFIDGKSICERTFWNTLNVLANFKQKEMIMDGLKVRIAESTGLNQKRNDSLESFLF